MPLPETLLNQMKCCLENDGHIAIEPIVLKCGKNACKKCIVDSKEEIVKCYGCNGQHGKKEVVDQKISSLGETLLHTFLNDLLDYVDQKLEKSAEALKCIKNKQAVNVL
jgi:hypothetical protein